MNCERNKKEDWPIVTCAFGLPYLLIAPFILVFKVGGGYFFGFWSGLTSCVVVGIFFFSYYHLFRRKDFYTALEIAIIGRLIAGINASFVICESYHSIALSYSEMYFRPPIVLDKVRFISVHMILLTPAFLSVPFVWFYLCHHRRMRLRFPFWTFLSLFTLTIDLLMILLMFIPLLVFDARLTP